MAVCMREIGLAVLKQVNLKLYDCKQRTMCSTEENVKHFGSRSGGAFLEEMKILGELQSQSVLAYYTVNSHAANLIDGRFPQLDVQEHGVDVMGKAGAEFCADYVGVWPGLDQNLCVQFMDNPWD
ncbi:hypothetical protein ACLOJK_027901 [Asimina triloba]